MFTFFKNIIKAIVIVMLLMAVIHLAFGGALFIFGAFGANSAAAWLFFFLVAVFACIITLAQENEFSKRAEKEFKAFWSW